jgi:pimeloyl-ACP methyl ester carboxylesterase
MLEYIFKKPKWKELEKQFIGEQAQRECITFDDGEYLSKVYYLTNPFTEIPEPTGDTYICIHGTAGTSLSFLSLIPHFPKGSRFYLLDLPGFGKSHTTCPSPNTDYYVECIRRFMKTLGINQSRFIAHSFGTFLTIHFASTYHEQVKSLTLIAPVGLLPTLGYNGLYWAILFRFFRFPYFIKYIRWVLWLLYRMNLFHGRTAYLLSCYGDRKTIMASHFRSFMSVEWKSYYVQGYWKDPILSKLLRLPVPISLIYGELDTLIPSDQGLVIRGLSSDITIDIVKNEGHSPVSQVPRLIIKRSKKNQNQKHVKHVSMKKIQKILSHPERYASYFSFHHTWLSIQRLYSDLLIN